MLYMLARIIRSMIYRTLDAIATLYYKLVCAEFGVGASIGWSTWISFPHNVFIGSNVRIGRNCEFGSEVNDSQLFIQENAQINSSVVIDFTGGVIISKNAFISEGVIIYSHDHGLDPRSSPKKQQKLIDEDSWIGARAIVLSKCEKIGKRSLIGAGSVVTKNVNDDMKVGGSPALNLK